MRWRLLVAYELAAFKWVKAPKRASVSVFALFFAALLSTVPINAQQFVSKFGSGRGQLNAPLGIAIEVDSAWPAATDNNRTQKFPSGDLVYVADTDNDGIQVLAKDGNSVFQSDVADNDDDPCNSPPVEGRQATFIFNGYFHLSAFDSLQVVDQICSYRFRLY